MNTVLYRRPAAGVLLALALSAGASIAAPARKTPPKTASAPAVVARCVTGSGENLKPFVLARPGGGAYLAWAQRDEERTSVLFSASSNGLDFGPPVRISADGMDLDLGAESGPQAAVGPGGAVYVAWTAGSWKVPSAMTMKHSGASAGGAGKGMPARPGNLNVYLAASKDGGRSFAPPVRMNDDPEGAEHRFPTVAVDPHGTLYVAWLDKRLQTAERPDFARVFFACSMDGGKSFSKNVDATAGQPTGICHCCKVALAARAGGRVAIAYRNDVEDVRDHYLAESSDGGRTFSVPHPIEETRWVIPACPFNGPSLAFDGEERLHAVWMSGGTVPGEPLLGKPTGARYKVLYRRMGGSAGAGGPLFLTEGAHPRIAVSPSGSAIVAWEQEGLRAAALPASGDHPSWSLRLSPAEASVPFPSIAVTPQGTLIAAWQQRGTDDRWQVWAGRVGLTEGGRMAVRTR